MINQKNQKPQLSEGESNSSKRRAEWQEKTHNTETSKVLEQDTNFFINQAVSSPCLSVVKKAEGACIEDTNGRSYLDFHGNNVHHIGYGHPDLKKAISLQMDALPFAPRRFACDSALELAKKLAEISPGNLSKVLFTAGGSDAIEVALKIARAATGRHKTISFWDSFHGAGFGAASVGGEQLFRSHVSGPLLPGTEHVAPFACYRCPYGYPDLNGKPQIEVCNSTCADFVRYVLEKEGDVAAVIAEPVRAVPYIPPPSYWKMVRQACNEYGALLIFDEIPTGLGKTGKMFACEHDDTIPDLLVLGKALGGGILPIAAVLSRAELDVAGNYALGHYTHEKNPVTAKAALTTIEIIEQQNLVENAEVLGKYMLDQLNSLKNKHISIGDVRGLGLLIGVELVLNRKQKTVAEDLAEDVLYRCLGKGLSFKITMGNVLTLSPPLIITREQIDLSLQILDQCIADAEEAAGL